MQNNKSLLIIIVVLLVGIFGMLAYEANQPKTTGEKIEDALNSAADDVGDAVEEVGEDIQDATKQ